MPPVSEKKKPSPAKADKNGKKQEPKKKSKKAPAMDVEKAIVHPEIKITLAIGNDAITAELAKELLGWEEETEGIQFTDHVPELTALFGRRIRLWHNTKNRYVTPSWVLTLKQEHLQKRWRFNGESIVIGKTGQVLSGQQRLLSLVLAEMERTGPQEHHWKENWPGPVTMESVLVYGIPEDDDTFGTLNRGKPGTLSELLYRSDWFSKLKPADRKTAAKICDGAIKMLWYRTGAGLDQFAPRRTHGEAMDFLARHPKLVQAVHHIRTEDADGNISKLIAPGAATALLYLMAASQSDVDRYRMADPSPAEKFLDLDLWDKAEAFWIEVSKAAIEAPIRNAVAALDDPETGAGAGLAEKVAVMCKAWLEFVQGHEWTEDALELNYTNTEDGGRKLDECPTVGGIDLGNPKDKEVEDEEEAEEPEEEAPAKAMTRKQKDDARKAQAIKDRLKNGVPALTALEELEALRKDHPGRMILTKSPTGWWAYGDDAGHLHKVIGVKVKPRDDELKQHASFPQEALEENLTKLAKAGHKVALAERNGKETTVTHVNKSK